MSSLKHYGVAIEQDVKCENPGGRGGVSGGKIDQHNKRRQRKRRGVTNLRAPACLLRKLKKLLPGLQLWRQSISAHQGPHTGLNDPLGQPHSDSVVNHRIIWMNGHEELWQMQHASLIGSNKQPIWHPCHEKREGWEARVCDSA